MSLLITNGRVIDPSQKLDQKAHLWIEKGRVAGIFPSDRPIQSLKKKAGQLIDASGAIVCPGLVDIHVHFREPGYEYKETIESGSRAALAGGVTSVACMGNTQPVNDSASITEFIMREANRLSLIHVYPIGAATKGLEGRELSEMADLKRAGCVAVSDDGHVIASAAVARKVMEYADTFCLPVISHAIDENLVAGGVMNEGWVSTELALPGIPNAAETIMIYRDIELSRLLNAHVHIAHVSTKEGVQAIRQAKKQKIPVTCEATPHHFTLTDEAVKGYNTNAKMMPPLRSNADLKEIWKGLADGTIDAIATDHAPHVRHEKERSFALAPNGIIGLETLLPLSFRLVEEKKISLSTMIERLTTGPANVLHLPAGTLKEGAIADLVIWSPEKIVKVDESLICSKSRNTPFWGWELKGRVLMTIVEGQVKYQDQ